MNDRGDGADFGTTNGHGGTSSWEDSNGRKNDSGDIQVCLRFRKMNKFEVSKRSRNCVEIYPPGIYGTTDFTVDSPLEGEYDFSFDQVFGEDASQSDVYEYAAAPLATKFMDGYNCALIAYGQTGSGKTQTMMGAKSAKFRTSSSVSRSDSLTTLSQGDEDAGKRVGNKVSNASNLDRGELGQDSKSNDEESNENDETFGMIPRIVKDIFFLMDEASPTVEYTIRCSYIEINMERIIDLFNPGNRSLKIKDRMELCDTPDDDDCPAVEKNRGVYIDGLSEICCIDESDVFSLLVRGNAHRTINGKKKQSDASQSHSIFTIKIEQNDSTTKKITKSRLHLVDMAGSEIAGTAPNKKTKEQVGIQGMSYQQEAKLINKSLYALSNVVKLLIDSQQTNNRGNGILDGCQKISVPYKKSKFTHILHEAFGGNCFTSVILTASPASFNISETISTIRFGQKCRRVKNFPRPNIDLSIENYKFQLHDSKRKEKELMKFIVLLGMDCKQLVEACEKSIDFRGNKMPPFCDKVISILKNVDVEDPYVKILHAVIEFNKQADDLIDPSKIKPSHTESHSTSTFNLKSVEKYENHLELLDEMEKKESVIASLRKELADATEARINAEHLLVGLKSEAAVLRSENGVLIAERKKSTEELIDAQNDIQNLSQRKLEVEHNLRTSQFRENEAAAFLRHFRRFYRRLLRNKAHQGSGNTSDVLEKVPGVPDLSDLIDIDTLLMESGLIEEKEMFDDSSTFGAYRPSAQALMRSAASAKKSVRDLASLQQVNEDEPFEDSSTDFSRSSGLPSNLGGIEAQSVSEMGDGGISVHYAREENSKESNGADDLTSIGARRAEQSESDKSDADAGAGSSYESLSVSESSSSIDHSSAVLGALPLKKFNIRERSLTPSARLSSMQEDALEKDLLRISKRCVELQVALNEERDVVEVLTNKTGSIGKRRLAEETLSLRQALEKKTHDLTAIIWKMNELHLINKMYNEKMSNREMHVAYLEESLNELQIKNRVTLSQRHISEKKLRNKIEKLKDLVDATSIPLWQFGETDGKHSLESRIIIPTQGGMGADEEEWDDLVIEEKSSDSFFESDEDGEMQATPKPKDFVSSQTQTEDNEVPMVETWTMTDHIEDEVNVVSPQVKTMTSVHMLSSFESAMAKTEKEEIESSNLDRSVSCGPIISRAGSFTDIEAEDQKQISLPEMRVKTEILNDTTESTRGTTIPETKEMPKQWVQEQVDTPTIMNERNLLVVTSEVNDTTAGSKTRSSLPAMSKTEKEGNEKSNLNQKLIDGSSTSRTDSLTDKEAEVLEERLLLDMGVQTVKTNDTTESMLRKTLPETEEKHCVQESVDASTQIYKPEPLHTSTQTDIVDEDGDLSYATQSLVSSVFTDRAPSKQFLDATTQTESNKDNQRSAPQVSAGVNECIAAATLSIGRSTSDVETQTDKVLVTLPSDGVTEKNVIAKEENLDGDLSFASHSFASSVHTESESQNIDSNARSMKDESNLYPVILINADDRSIGLNSTSNCEDFDINNVSSMMKDSEIVCELSSPSNVDKKEDITEKLPESLLLGAKSNAFVPRRFTKKLGSSIKSGVLKEINKNHGGSVRSGRSGRSVGSGASSVSSRRRRTSTRMSRVLFA